MMTWHHWLEMSKHLVAQIVRRESDEVIEVGGESNHSNPGDEVEERMKTKQKKEWKWRKRRRRQGVLEQEREKKMGKWLEMNDQVQY